MNEDNTLLADEFVKTEKSTTHACSFAKSFNNVILANLGISILAMAYGIKIAGIFLAFSSLFFVYLVATFSGILLHDLASVLNKDPASLTEFVDFTVGKKFTLFVSIVLIINSLGPTTSYFIYFVELIHRNSCKHNLIFLCEDKSFILVVALIMIIFLSLFPTVNNYSYVSIFGNFCIFVSYGIIFYYATSKYSTQDYSVINYFDILGFPSAFALSNFSITASSILFEVRRELEFLNDFPSLMKSSYFATGFLTFFLPLTFYLGFLNETKPVILFNLPMEDILGSTAQILYGLSLLLSFPLVLLPVYFIVGNWISPNLNTNQTNDCNNTNIVLEPFSAKFFVVRIGVAVIIFLLGAFFKEIYIIIELGGAFASTALVFVIPFYIYEYYLYEHPNVTRNFNKNLNLFILVLGIFLMVFNTQHAMRSLFVKKSAFL